MSEFSLIDHDTLYEEYTTYPKDINKNTRYIFTSKDNLIKTILKYKDLVFTDVKISESLIMHLCNYFIIFSKHITDRLCIKERTDFLTKTLILFNENFRVDCIDILSDEPLANGNIFKSFFIK